MRRQDDDFYVDYLKAELLQLEIFGMDLKTTFNYFWKNSSQGLVYLLHI